MFLVFYGLFSLIAFQTGENEVMVAVQAAKLISCQEARANFQNTSEFIHQLFVCISGWRIVNL
jgi:hypothetical protein